MHAVLTSFGSTGDYEPFLALALALKREGHQVVLAFPPSLLARAYQLGLAEQFFPIGTHALVQGAAQLIETETQQGTLQRDLHAHFNFEQMRKWLFDLRRACVGADLLISDVTSPMGRMLHELDGIAWVSINFDHCNQEFAQEANEKIAASEQQVAGPINQFRRSFGLPAIENPITTGANSDQLALFATTSLILDPNKEDYWPSHYHVTGNFYLDHSDWQPEPGLADFLSQGDPPVAITMGSMVCPDPEKFTQILCQSIEALGCRVILNRGWAGLAKGLSLPDNIFLTDFVPYQWLFPRIGCVVQAGGAGTTAWALRAGIPSVCIPHIWGYFSFATFAWSMGTAPPPIPFDQLTADRLTTAIRQVLTDPCFKQAAQKLSPVIEAEQGIEKACALIHTFWQNR